MLFNENLFILGGRLGEDPILRKTRNGVPVCHLRVASDRAFRAKDKEGWQRSTEWFRVSVFGQRGEHCAKHLRKGFCVYIRGHLITNSWQDPDGQWCYSIDLFAEKIEFLETVATKPQGPPQARRDWGREPRPAILESQNLTGPAPGEEDAYGEPGQDKERSDNGM